MISYKKNPIGAATHHAGMLLGAFVMAFPFIWMVLTSLKTFPETMRIPLSILPEQPHWQNYSDIVQRFDIGLYYRNTIFITACLLLGQILICSMAAFSFNRLKFPGRRLLFFLILSIMMIPVQMIMIPRFLITNEFGWVNTYWGVIIPQLPSAYGVFFVGQFMRTIPREMEEAAMIDGCSIPRMFFTITLPLSVNGLLAFGLIVLLWSWNELLWPLTVTSSDSLSVLSVGLARLNAMPGYASQYNLLMAGSVLITLPMLVVFVIVQKRFVSGIVIGGIKA